MLDPRCKNCGEFANAGGNCPGWDRSENEPLSALACWTPMRQSEESPYGDAANESAPARVAPLPRVSPPPAAFCDAGYPGEMVPPPPYSPGPGGYLPLALGNAEAAGPGGRPAPEYPGERLAPPKHCRTADRGLYKNIREHLSPAEQQIMARLAGKGRVCVCAIAMLAVGLMLNAQCSMLNAQCSMPDEQCSMLNAQCSMPDEQCSGRADAECSTCPDGMLNLSLRDDQCPLAALPLSLCIEHCSLNISSLLTAIRLVESGGNDRAVGDKGKAIGPYQLHLPYWIDGGGEPGRYRLDAWDAARCRPIIMAYWKRHCPAALTGGDLQTLARIHNGGPAGVKRQATMAYWRKVQAAMRRAPA